VIWEHTVQGMFCDPAYGGNRDAIGWRLLGFPGAQWSYSTEQRARGFDATSIPIRTLADLQRERPWDTRPDIDLEKDKGDAPSN
jgi:gluconate 2-dehydrogenase gamma chain